MKILQGLVAGSVISSPGWFLNRDRTLRITGGPRATEVDSVLIIETDTLEPFKIVEETGKTLAKGKSEQELLQEGEQAQLAAAAASAGAAAEPSTAEASAAKMRRTKSTGHPGPSGTGTGVSAGLSSDSDSDVEKDAHGSKSPSKPAASSGTSTPGTVKDKLAEWGASLSVMTEGALQRGLIMYSRFRPGATKLDDEKQQPASTSTSTSTVDAGQAPSASLLNTTTDQAAKKEKEALAAAEQAKSDAGAPPTYVDYSSPPPDTNTGDGSSPLEALLEMGFSPIEANDALRTHGGDLKAAIEELLARDSEKVRQMAVAVPLPASPPVAGGEEKVAQALEGALTSVQAGEAGATSIKGTASPSVAPTATPKTEPKQTPETQPKKPPMRVVGGESLETPHWSQQVREAATSTELGKIAVAEVMARSKAFLAGDAARATSPRFPSRAKVAAASWAAMGGSPRKEEAKKLEVPASSGSGSSSWLKRSKSDTGGKAAK
ncbi:hypothetical protein V8E36_000843 [Tilletia maclaganii]